MKTCGDKFSLLKRTQREITTFGILGTFLVTTKGEDGEIKHLVYSKRMIYVRPAVCGTFLRDEPLYF